MKPAYLVHGLPGHPLHPPLTDVTIGSYTFATVAAFCDVVGISNHAAAQAWWLALLFGLISTTLTAAAGFVDWLRIEWGTPLWRTATTHAIANLLAGVLFLVALLAGHGDFQRGDVTAGPFALTVAGFAMLTLGGWLGGAVVFVHGMRVLNLVDEPALRAALPAPTLEKEEAEAG
ncbi:MAG TPA: DUF2231 domain-containing protein [Gaiellaceae bacterium]|jgi:uncharacterized membrane protein